MLHVINRGPLKNEIQANVRIRWRGQSCRIPISQRGEKSSECDHWSIGSNWLDVILLRYLWEIPVSYMTSLDSTPVRVWMHKVTNSTYTRRYTCIRNLVGLFSYILHAYIA